jgi:hypothetical protein
VLSFTVNVMNLTEIADGVWLDPNLVIAVIAIPPKRTSETDRTQIVMVSERIIVDRPVLRVIEALRRG